MGTHAPSAEEPAGLGDLTLQPVEGGEADPYLPLQGKKGIPQTLPGKPIDIGDPTKYLIVAATAGALAVVIGTWWFFRTPDRPEAPQETAGSQADAVPGEKAKPGTSTARTKGGTAGSASPQPKASGGTKGRERKAPTQAEPSKEEQYLANPANQTCFHCYYAFMEWAQEEGLQLGGEVLATRFKGKVSQSGVSDPKLHELYGKFLELCAIAPQRPLMPPDLSTQLVPGSGGAQRLAPAAEAKKQKLLMLELRTLATQLQARYGKP